MGHRVWQSWYVPLPAGLVENKAGVNELHLCMKPYCGHNDSVLFVEVSWFQGLSLVFHVYA